MDFLRAPSDRDGVAGLRRYASGPADDERVSVNPSLDQCVGSKIFHRDDSGAYACLVKPDGFRPDPDSEPIRVLSIGGRPKPSRPVPVIAASGRTFIGGVPMKR